jgi:D-serine deaminase-like pyridoxal phosphate-dependent protein
MIDQHPFIGKHIREADTPALWIDLDAFEANARKILALCANQNVRWRPHVKASKSPDLARLLIDIGAQGITCAKVAEAEAMAAGGITDILVANEIVGEIKIKRLVEVAKQARVGVACDNEKNISEISSIASSAGVNIDILVDINVGANRCGVSPELAPALAQQVISSPGVSLRGLMGYEGHVMGMQPEDKEAASAQSAEILAAAKSLVEASGVPVDILSGGGSGNYWHAATLGSINELQAGGGALMDISYKELMKLPDHEYALYLSAQVVSIAVPGRAILDAGWKTTGRHTGLPVITSHEGAQVASLNAEHTIVDLAENVTVQHGDRMTLVPHYSDSTVLLHREIYAVREEIIRHVWEITGAGALK